jgi:hypothetical protein
VLSAPAVLKSYKEENWGKQVSSVQESVTKRCIWKGVAIHRGLEGGSRRASSIRSGYQGTAGAVLICKVRISAVAL